MNTRSSNRCGHTARAVFTFALFVLTACGGQTSQQDCSECDDGSLQSERQHLPACDPNVGCGGDEVMATTTVSFRNNSANSVYIMGSYSLDDPYSSGSLSNGQTVAPGATVQLSSLRTNSGSMNLQLNVVDGTNNSFGGAIGFTPVNVLDTCMATYSFGTTQAFHWSCG